MEKNLTLIEVIFPKIENKILILVRDLVLIFSFAILTGLCAKLKIEIGPVPITMQTFSVLLSGALLGAKRGALSQITYLSMGFAGIPWFSRGGGMAYLLSPTFGYLVGFVFASFFVGFLCQKGFDRKLERAVLAMFFGNLLIYLPGLFWLARFVGLEKVLAVGFFPFVLGDVLKIILAGSILPLAWKILKVKKS
jgi:biotin transporter BioY